MKIPARSEARLEPRYEPKAAERDHAEERARFAGSIQEAFDRILQRPANGAPASPPRETRASEPHPADLLFDDALRGASSPALERGREPVANEAPPAYGKGDRGPIAQRIVEVGTERDREPEPRALAPRTSDTFEAKPREPGSARQAESAPTSDAPTPTSPATFAVPDEARVAPTAADAALAKRALAAAALGLDGAAGPTLPPAEAPMLEGLGRAAKGASARFDGTLPMLTGAASDLGSLAMWMADGVGGEAAPAEGKPAASTALAGVGALTTGSARGGELAARAYEAAPRDMRTDARGGKAQLVHAETGRLVGTAVDKGTRAVGAKVIPSTPTFAIGTPTSSERTVGVAPTVPVGETGFTEVTTDDGHRFQFAPLSRTTALVRFDHPTLGPLEIALEQHDGTEGRGLDVAILARSVSSAIALRGTEEALRGELRAKGTELRALRVRTDSERASDGSPRTPPGRPSSGRAPR